MGKSMIGIGKKRVIERVPRYGLADQDEITWYIENDLDLTEYYNKLEEKEKNVGKPKKKKK